DGLQAGEIRELALAGTPACPRESVERREDDVLGVRQVQGRKTPVYFDAPLGGEAPDHVAGRCDHCFRSHVDNLHSYYRHVNYRTLTIFPAPSLLKSPRMRG